MLPKTNPAEAWLMHHLYLAVSGLLAIHSQEYVAHLWMCLYYVTTLLVNYFWSHSYCVSSDLQNRVQFHM